MYPQLYLIFIYTNKVPGFSKFQCQPHKMVKHTQTIRRLLPTNRLSEFDEFVGLVLKGLS